MDTILVIIDDAAHAQRQLAQLEPAPGSAPRTAALHWVLVACPPRVTRRINKWVSYAARENWRTKWADRLFGQLAPALRAAGDTVTTVVADGPLADLTARLTLAHQTRRVIDARRPKAGAPDRREPEARPSDTGPLWKLPAVAGMGALLALAAE